MANVHTILSGRLVEDPREFQTKAGDTLLSIRVADNPSGSREGDGAWFVEVTLGKGLAGVARERGLAKGDTVNVSGQLHKREYTDKKGAKRESHEIRFVDAFQVVRAAADSRPKAEDAGYDPDPEATAPVTDAGTAEDPYGFGS